MGESIAVPILKSGLYSDCANHTAINPIPISSGILRRLFNTHELEALKEQAGLCTGRPNIYPPAGVATLFTFFDIRAAFGSVDKCDKWHCFLGNRVLEKCVSDPKDLYQHNSGRNGAYG